MGNRFSSLPIAQFCGLAPSLAAVGGAGRSAAMGSAFHARCADPDGAEAKDRWLRLTPEERAVVETWRKPTDLVLECGAVLSYDQAYKELPLGLTASGTYAPKGTPGNVTEGTCDICWVVEQGGMRIVYVPDIKRSEWTVAEGPESLQIMGYALAAMHKFEADGFCAGIWAAQEGRWWWGDLILAFRDEDIVLDLWRRIRAAALNDSVEPARGPHCNGCYGRTHCPSWMMPPSLLGTELAPFAEPGMALTSAQAAELILKIKQVEDVAKTVKEHVIAQQKAGLRVLDGKGKEYRAVPMPGRAGFNSKQFQEDFPDLYPKYHTDGAPYEQYRWCNADPKPKKRTK